jgi:hypothetical protein
MQLTGMQGTRAQVHEGTMSGGTGRGGTGQGGSDIGIDKKPQTRGGTTRRILPK